MKNYQSLARAIQSQENCARSGNAEWYDRWQATIDAIMEGAPSGSGFDSGTQLYNGSATTKKIVFHTAFHHLNDVGEYTGWTEHDVVMTPDLAHGFVLSITGRNKRDIKEYIAEIFQEWLDAECRKEA